MKNPTETVTSGTLYVVATPIGNLEDITLRAIRILKQVSIIAAESPEHTKRLCDHFDIRNRITAYNQHNHKKRIHHLLQNLSEGKDIALVSSAGTPAVSDPGALFVKEALDAGISVSPVPGPSAAIAALSVCGFKTDNFRFAGFLSNRQGKRKKQLRDLENEQTTIIFYESPRRVAGALRDIQEVFGDRRVVILRELTKIYEERISGQIGRVIETLEADEIRGEFTIIIEGKDSSADSNEIDSNILEDIESGLKKGDQGTKNMALILSEKHGLNYRILYKKILEIKKERDNQ